MASSQNLTAELAQALRERDEARRLVASAQQLSTDESVAEEHRHALAQEYADRLAAAEAEVERIKALISDRRVEMMAELDGLRREESALEVRQKVGEYSPAQFKSATADLRRRIDSLSRQDTSFAALLEAETEAEVGRVPRQSGAPGVGAPRATEGPAVAAPEVPAASGGGLRGSLAGARAATPKWLFFGSLGLVIVGAVAVVVLFLAAAGGGDGGLNLNLPSLPGLFQGGDETPTTPATPTAPTTPLLPTREPTTPAATTAPAAKEASMSVDLLSAPNVGSLLIEMTYDTAALELVRVQQASLPSDVLFDYGVSQGRVVIGLVTASGLNGSGSLASLTFKRAAGAPATGESTVAAASVQIYRADTLAQIVPTVSAGRVNLSSMSATTLSLSFG